MRHPESQRFYQSSGSGGGGGAILGNMAVPTAPASKVPVPYGGRADADRRRRAGQPAPVSITGKSPQELKAMHAQGLIGPGAVKELQEQVRLSGGAGQPDMDFGKRYEIPQDKRAQPGENDPYAMPGGPSLAPFKGQKHMWVGGTPAKYSKADVKRERDLSDRMRGQAAVFSQRRDAFTKDMVQQQYGWIEAARKEQAEAGTEAGAARDQYLKASKSIQRNRARLEKMEIDPDRYWNSLTETQQTMTRVKQMFGALAVGFSQGRIKNSATEALKRAQERDMVAQNTNMKKLLQTIDLDDRDRTALWSRWQAGEAKRRQTGFAVMQLQLSRAGLMEKRLGIKEQYAGVVNQLDAHMNEVLRGTRGSGGRRVATPEYASQLRKEEMAFGVKTRADYQLRNQTAAIRERGKYMKGRAGDRGDLGAENAIEQIEDMIKSYEGSAWADVPVLGAVTDDAANYKQKKGLLGLSLWRMFDSGKLSDADMKMAFTMFFPNAKRSLFSTTRGVDVRQMRRLRGWLKTRMRGAGHYQNKTLAGAKKKFASTFGIPEDKFKLTNTPMAAE